MMCLEQVTWSASFPGLLFIAEHDPFTLFGLLFPKISQSAKFIDVETLPNRN